MRNNSTSTTAKNSIDPLAEKFYSISPYAYVNNSPRKYIDLKGDSISVTSLLINDNMTGTNYVQTKMNDLQNITGLTYSISTTGMLVYDKDTNGNAKVLQNTQGHLLGSETARNHMISVLNNPDIILAGIIPEHLDDGSQAGGRELWLKPSQINAFIAGSKNIDNRTLGCDMTFIHESYHTKVGGGLSDAPYTPGPVVTNMNIIRAELNAQGGNYGQRVNYILAPVGFRDEIIPFSNSANEVLKSTGIIPVGLPYVITKW